MLTQIDEVQCELVSLTLEVFCGNSIYRKTREAAGEITVHKLSIFSFKIENKAGTKSSLGWLSTYCHQGHYSSSCD